MKMDGVKFKRKQKLEMNSKVELLLIVFRSLLSGARSHTVTETGFGSRYSVHTAHSLGPWGKFT